MRMVDFRSTGDVTDGLLKVCRCEAYRRRMCRNITILRGLEPPATPDEVEAAARQYVRKVGGVQAPSPATTEAFEKAVRAVTHATAELLAELPLRRNPPATVPPLHRRVDAVD